MTLFSLALAVLPLVTAAQGTPDTDAGAATALDGRLGGTRESFERIYGPSHASGIDRAFEIDGYGLVQVQFGGTDQTGPALVITLRSPRDAAIAATEPDPADWSVGKARQRMKRFLPADTRLGQPEAPKDGGAALSCASETIAAVFGGLGDEDGNCRVGFIMPTTKTVSYATATLTSDPASAGDQTAATDDCDGMVAWANATGRRLTRAQTALDEVASIPDGAPDAADRLNQASATFSMLTDEQRAESAPTAAATANYYLIGGFNGYATALASASAAVKANDPQGAATAADGFAAAGKSITRGVTELETAIADCGLSAATPAATP